MTSKAIEDKVMIYEDNITCDTLEAEYGHSECNLVSSTSMGDDNNIVIIEESADPHSITGILNVCKKKLLKPYMRFLSLMGLRPIFGESTEQHCLIKFLNLFYTLQVISFLITGYFLQYVSCFRRDRGFGSISSVHALTKSEKTAIYEETCSGSLITSFVIPSLLHFAGYMYALIIFRRGDDNQLPVLIERVFLLSSNVLNMQMNQRHIVRTLWIFVIGSFLWMFSSITLVNYMMAEGDISFRLFSQSPTWLQILLKILLVTSIIWHDIVQASVISNYCLQVQLLKTYIQFIREKLLQQSIRTLEWIRDIEEFRKLLSYLNDEVAPAVCIFTLVNWTYAISGTLWLLASQNHVKDDIVPLYTTVNILNVLLWWFIALVPFIQCQSLIIWVPILEMGKCFFRFLKALLGRGFLNWRFPSKNAARLTMACDNVKTVGQEVRTRPLGHQDTSLHELNSILIYTTSLKINAKLFNLPINGKYTGIVFAIVAVYFLVLGQSNYFSH